MHHMTRILTATLAMSALLLSCTAVAQSAGCSITTTTINGVSTTTITGTGCGSTSTPSDFSIIVSPDVWVGCSETIKDISPDSVDETLQSLEACILVDHGDEKALPGVLYYIVTYAASIVLPRVPAAYSSLMNLVNSYGNGTQFSKEEFKKMVSRDLVRFLRQNGFVCRSSTNVFTCRWPRSS